MKLNGKIQIIHVWSRPELIGDPDVIRKMLEAVVSAIHMTPHEGVKIQFYPTPELGFTAKVSVLQPFDAIQHLYESYIIYDNWIELGYANIIINSCKDFNSLAALDVIMKHLPPGRYRLEDAVYYDGEH